MSGWAPAPAKSNIDPLCTSSPSITDFPSEQENTDVLVFQQDFLRDHARFKRQQQSQLRRSGKDMHVSTSSASGIATPGVRSILIDTSAEISSINDTINLSQREQAAQVVCMSFVYLVVSGTLCTCCRLKSACAWRCS